MDRQWEAIKFNLLAISYLVAPLHRNKRSGLLPWCRSKIIKVRKRIHTAFMRFKDTELPKLPEVHSGEKEKSMHLTTMPNCLRGSESWAVKSNPEAYYHYLQSKAAL